MSSEIDFNKYSVANPQTGQIDTALTIEKFEKELNQYVEDRENQANKYKKAVINVFKKFPGKTVGGGMVENFALYETGLAPTADNFAIVRNVISALIEDDILVRHGTKGKGAGISLKEGRGNTVPPPEETDETELADEFPAHEEEEEEVSPKKMVIVPSKKVAGPNRR